MDFVAILQTIRRNLLIVVPIALLTLAATVFLMSSRSLEFTSDTSVVLLTPPSPPIDNNGNFVTRTEHGSTDNPLTRFGNSATVVDVVARAISTPEAREQLAKEGADSRYKVAPADTGPIAQITTTADTAAAATKTVQVVTSAFVAKLAELQAARDIDPTYTITTLPVDEPTTPTGSYFSTVRLAIGVVGLGLVAAFFAVSIAEGIRQNRQRPDDDEDPPRASTASNGRSPSDTSAATKPGWGDWDTRPEPTAPNPATPRPAPPAKSTAPPAKPKTATKPQTSAK